MIAGYVLFEPSEGVERAVSQFQLDAQPPNAEIMQRLGSSRRVRRDTDENYEQVIPWTPPEERNGNH